MVGNRREAREALGMGGAEVGEPLVVDAHHLDGRLRIVHAAGGTEDAVEHFALHAVKVLIANAQLRLGEPANTLLAVLVEAGGGHAVGAMDATRHVLSPT